jgi:hypothetical protein
VNAEHAARGVVASPEDVAEHLQTSGEALADALRELSDADLARQVQFGPQVLPAETITQASIRHVQVHLKSIQEAVETASPR